jgi:hypothetical protein
VLLILDLTYRSAFFCNFDCTGYSPGTDYVYRGNTLDGTPE